MEQVGKNVAHRKECGEVSRIDLALLKYPLTEQSLLLVQCTGVTYTCDCLSHAVGLEVSRACPLCGQDGSRLHRAKFCEVVADLRGPLLSFLGDRELPAHTWAYGLWGEPASLRDWQADACALEWPFLVESYCGWLTICFHGWELPVA